MAANLNIESTIGITSKSELNLSPEETECAIRVARMLTLAEQVFSDHNKALEWLRTPDIRLNDRTPLSMLPTEAGGRLVESMLWQIDEGIYA